MEKKQKRILIISGTILSVLIISMFISLDPFAISYTSVPSAPVLDSVQSPNLDGSIELSWSAPAETQHFELWITREDLGGAWLPRALSDDSLTAYVTTYVDNYVADGHTYSWKVVAVNPLGKSPDSNIVSVAITIEEPIEEPIILPSVPILNLNEQMLDSDLIGLVWSISQNTVGYEVYRSTNNGVSYTLFKTLTYNSFWFDTSYGSYSYKVRAYNDDGYSAYSNIVSITIDYPLLPTVPVLNPIPSPDTDGSISLSWSPSQNNVIGYHVHRSISGGAYIHFKTSTWASVSFVETDGSYSYKVRAYNDISHSDFSNIVSVIVDIPFLPPAPYLNVISPSTDTDGSIDLIWAVLTGIDSYEVYRNKDGGIFSLITTTTSTSYRDSGLTNGVYRYKIIAKYIDGDSPYSNVVSVIVDIPSTPAPPAPPVLNTIVSPNDDGVIELTWDPDPNVIDYDLYRSYNGGSYTLLTTLTNSYYTDTVLINGTYSYEVKARNDVGHSDFSNSMSVLVNVIEGQEGQVGPSIDYTLLCVLLGVIGVSAILVIMLLIKRKK